jgi:lambda family phage minor tail protein L
MTTLSAAAQSLTPGERIALYRLDATSIGGGVRFFTQATDESGIGISFGGQTYIASDIIVEQFETNAGGVLPTPTMRIANTDLMIQALVNEFGDLAGCELRRVRTFKRFLDGQPDADPLKFIGPDVFRIERKTDENPVFIEWELSAAIDQEGKLLPGRQFIRDTCTRRYRIYDPTSPRAASDGYVYSNVFPCQYSGGNAWTSTGQPTTAANDVCGRKDSDCQLRFGNVRKTSAFPAMGRVRTS